MCSFAICRSSSGKCLVFGSSYSTFLFILGLFFFFFKEEREEGRENIKQAPCPERSPIWGLDLTALRSRPELKIKSWTFNQLSHPGAQESS